ncbi:hypothetical protein VP01_903g2 [Puccinia sorghi]|uniref:Uncharacterized protein n=1 Tax=Puccinia sorghi TaxID=27349 RepID=A0A0L6U9V7_9BASI|nr:hypothetical protein VP01_903g2 [Puccinia sorghi]
MCCCLDLFLLVEQSLMSPTNRIDILDPALLRSGRLDRKIEFPLPTEDARARIIEMLMPFLSSIILNQLIFATSLLLTNKTHFLCSHRLRLHPVSVSFFLPFPLIYLLLPLSIYISGVVVYVFCWTYKNHTVLPHVDSLIPQALEHRYDGCVSVYSHRPVVVENKLLSKTFYWDVFFSFLRVEQLTSITLIMEQIDFFDTIVVGIVNFIFFSSYLAFAAHSASLNQTFFMQRFHHKKFLHAGGSGLTHAYLILIRMFISFLKLFMFISYIFLFHLIFISSLYQDYLILILFLFCFLPSLHLTVFFLFILFDLLFFIVFFIFFLLFCHSMLRYLEFTAKKKLAQQPVVDMQIVPGSFCSYYHCADCTAAVSKHLHMKTFEQFIFAHLPSYFNLLSFQFFNYILLIFCLIIFKFRRIQIRQKSMNFFITYFTRFNNTIKKNQDSYLCCFQKVASARCSGLAPSSFIAILRFLLNLERATKMSPEIFVSMLGFGDLVFYLSSIRYKQKDCFHFTRMQISVGNQCFIVWESCVGFYPHSQFDNNIKKNIKINKPYCKGWLLGEGRDKKSDSGKFFVLEHGSQNFNFNSLKSFLNLTCNLLQTKIPEVTNRLFMKVIMSRYKKRCPQFSCLFKRNTIGQSINILSIFMTKNYNQSDHLNFSPFLLHQLRMSYSSIEFLKKCVLRLNLGLTFVIQSSLSGVDKNTLYQQISLYHCQYKSQLCASHKMILELTSFLGREPWNMNFNQDKSVENRWERWDKSSARKARDGIDNVLIRDGIFNADSNLNLTTLSMFPYYGHIKKVSLMWPYSGQFLNVAILRTVSLMILMTVSLMCPYYGCFPYGASLICPHSGCQIKDGFLNVSILRKVPLIGDLNMAKLRMVTLRMESNDGFLNVAILKMDSNYLLINIAISKMDTVLNMATLRKLSLIRCGAYIGEGVTAGLSSCCR